MSFVKGLWVAVLGASCLLGCSGDPETDTSPEPKTEIEAAKILDLDDLVNNPEPYDWFDFRPNIQKLILAGAAEGRHIAILWYTVEDGGVARHYHAKTESVYVIDGTQTDGKGTYDTGDVYFNPPGSGHEVTASSGFFLLAYASPPDFASVDLIEEYTPVSIDTADAKLTSAYEFETQSSGAKVFSPSLDTEGGLSASFIEVTGSSRYELTGNYVLVLRGSCDVEGVKVGERHLVVGDSVEPQPYALTASGGGSCLALGLSF